MTKKNNNLELVDDMVRESLEQLRVFQKAIRSVDGPVSDEEKGSIADNFFEQLIRSEYLMSETQKVMTKMKKDITKVRHQAYDALRDGRVDI